MVMSGVVGDVMVKEIAVVEEVLVMVVVVMEIRLRRAWRRHLSLGESCTKYRRKRSPAR